MGLTATMNNGLSFLGPPAVLGECPRWDERRQELSWVDIDGGTLFTAAPQPGGWMVTPYDVGTPLPGATLVHDGHDDRWLVAVGSGLAAWSPASGLGPPVEIETTAAPSPLRLNELVTDPTGRVWVGSMAYDWTPRAGGFFRIDPDGGVRRVIDGITIANGVGWSPDGTRMYTTDTVPGRITAWDYDLRRGQPSRPRVLVDAAGADGRPDGLAVDEDGNLWSAFAGGHRISCFSPAGRELHRLPVPAPNPTSCCFAGPERDRLLVTTGRKRLPASVLAEFPDSGRVFDAGPIGVRGLPQPRTTVTPEALHGH
jgi:sugar lactone lactonase YvrE